MRSFEDEYAMNSADFILKFDKGEVEDNIDFIKVGFPLWYEEEDPG